MKFKQTTVRKLISLGILILLTAFFSFSSNTFLTAQNLLTILREASVVGVVATGMTFVIITAGIDLSVGSIMAMVAMACINMIRFTGIPIPLIILIGILIGTAGGYLNGVVVTKLHVPDFIASLAAMGVYRGVTLMIAVKQNGMIVSTGIKNPIYTGLGGAGGGIYYVSIAFILVAALGHLLLKYTRMGTYTYAIGANLKSALLSGIKASSVKRFVFAFSGFCCAIGGIFTSARMRTATVELGTGFETDVIAAVVVGGTSMSGGRGDVIGTFIGALFLAVLDNGIRKFEISSAFMTMLRGGIIVFVVIFDAWYQRRHQEKLRRSSSLEELTSEVAA